MPKPRIKKKILKSRKSDKLELRKHDTIMMKLNYFTKTSHCSPHFLWQGWGKNTWARSESVQHSLKVAEVNKDSLSGLILNSRDQRSKNKMRKFTRRVLWASVNVECKRTENPDLSVATRFLIKDNLFIKWSSESCISMYRRLNKSDINAKL